MTRLSLAQRIVAITATALIPILGALAYNEVALRLSRGEEVGALALGVARQAALEMEWLTSGTEGILHAIAAAPPVAALDAGPCEDYLPRLDTDLPQFTNLVVVDASGISVCRSDRGGEPPDLSDRPYFADAMAAGGRLVIGEHTVSRSSGRPVLPMALSILDPSGRPVGVVVTAFDLEWLGATLRERRLARNGSLTIADRDGTIIAREPLPEQFVGTVIPEASTTTKLVNCGMSVSRRAK